MTVFGIAMVRNEADIIEHVIEHMLTQVDQIIVADNMSTDGTREILESLPVTVVTDPEVGYYQSDKMTGLAGRAFRRGASWLVPFDADEVWVSRTGARIADELDAFPGGVLIAEADVWDHVSTGLDDPKDPNPITRIQHRRPTRLPLPKVACRARRDLAIAQGNHGASYEEPQPQTIRNLLTVRHFPYRSVEQFIRKVRQGAAAYRATDLPESMGAHWRQWGAILDSQGEEAVAGIYRKWFWRADAGPTYCEGELQPALVFDPAPIWVAS